MTEEETQKKLQDQDLKKQCLYLANESVQHGLVKYEDLIEEAKKIYSYITE